MSNDMCRRERIRYRGQLGWTHYIHPNYINLRLDNGNNISVVPPEDVEFIIMSVIDTTKPLEIYHNSTADEAMFVTETSDHNILVSRARDNFWMIFDYAGAYVRSQNGMGIALKLRNKQPVKACEYHAVDRCGAVVIATYLNRAVAWDQNPNATHLIQIDKTDGVVTGVGVLKRST